MTRFLLDRLCIGKKRCRSKVLAVESSPCKYSWTLEVSERRSGSTTLEEKEAKVFGLAKTDTSAKSWRA